MLDSFPKEFSPNYFSNKNIDNAGVRVTTEPVSLHTRLFLDARKEK